MIPELKDEFVEERINKSGVVIVVGVLGGRESGARCLRIGRVGVSGRSGACIGRPLPVESLFEHLRMRDDHVLKELRLTFEYLQAEFAFQRKIL